MDAGFKSELIAWGVDWDEILDRFMGNEDLIAKFMFKFLNDQSMSNYGFEYQVFDLEESIKRTEG